MIHKTSACGSILNLINQNQNQNGRTNERRTGTHC